MAVYRNDHSKRGGMHEGMSKKLQRRSVINERMCENKLVSHYLKLVPTKKKKSYLQITNPMNELIYVYICHE